MKYETTAVSNSKEKMGFLRLPFIIYQNDPNWVPPMVTEVKRVLNVKRNPYFKKASLKLFICKKDDNIVSRIAIIIDDEYRKQYGTKTAFFGFFETCNDKLAVQSLFESVERYCREENVTILEGPFNPNHYSELGLQIDKFGSMPSFFQTYNPDYYKYLLEGYGFKISMKLHTRKNDNVREYVLKRYGDKQNITYRENYRIRSFSEKHKRRDLQYFREINNNAFSTNWHFLPLSVDEYLFSAKYLKLVSDPDHIRIVEYMGEPVGVIHFALDINPALKKMNGKISPLKYFNFLRDRKKISKIIIFSVGIRKSNQHMYTYKLLLNAACDIASGYQSVETTWMYDENVASICAARNLGMEPDKTFAIYQKIIK